MTNNSMQYFIDENTEGVYKDRESSIMYVFFFF